MQSEPTIPTANNGGLVLHPVANRRCGSCERWHGERRAGADGHSIELDSEMRMGVCRGGPWDNSERRARSACGRWTVWTALPQR